MDIRANEGTKSSTQKLADTPGGWTFLTNHSHVLVVLSRDPMARIQDISQEVGITYRAVQRILADLVTAGVLTVTKHGRRNAYQINHGLPLRHRLESHRHIGDLLEMLG